MKGNDINGKGSIKIREGYAKNGRRKEITERGKKAERCYARTYSEFLRLPAICFSLRML